MKPQTLFPPLSPKMYAIPASDYPLLHLAATRLKPSQLARGNGLDPLGKLARLMALHKLAFEAELAGAWKRADFYFEKCHLVLQKIAADDQVWQQFQQKFQLATAPGDLIQQVVNEAFIETHLAFYRSAGNSEDVPEPQLQRNLHHLESAYRLAVSFQQFLPEDLVLDIYAQLILNLSDRGEKDRVLSLIQNGKTGGKFDAFLSASERDIVFTRAMNSLVPKNAKTNVRILEKAANHVNALHPKLPEDLEWYNQLGMLYLQLAIHQANAGTLSKALLSVEKAGAYNPHLQDLEAVKNQLKGLMTNLQTQMAQVKRQLSYNQKLTPEGQKLMNEANVGSRLARQFLESSQLQDILEARSQATYTTSDSFFQRKKPVTSLFSAGMPAIPVMTTGRQRSETPFIFWLFSSKGWLVKSASIAAVVLLGFTVFHTVRENLRFDQRDSYYSAIQQAVQQGEPLPVISSQAAGFLSNLPSFGTDPRTGQVLDWYEKAFTKWFVQAENLDTPEAGQELQLFTSMTN